jgi:hypothetical protein
MRHQVIVSHRASHSIKYRHCGFDYFPFKHIPLTFRPSRAQPKISLRQTLLFDRGKE